MSKSTGKQENQLKSTVLLNEMFHRICSGAWPPGKPLRLENLAREFRVSRTPVRDALKVLTEVGLVTQKPRSISHVAPIDANTFFDMIEVRAVLEGLAVRNFTRRASRVDILRLQAYSRRITEAAQQGDSSACVRAEVAFHNYIIKHCGNSQMHRVLNPRFLEVFIWATAHKKESDLSAKASFIEHQHTTLLEAILSGDPTHAEQCMHKHVYDEISNSTKAKEFLDAEVFAAFPEKEAQRVL